ncbi:MAG: hypothetical protein WC154_08375 [Candidatus Izemoplasmatales bacterium]
MLKFETINSLNKNIYRRSFIQWMNKEYPNIQRPNIMFSNIMLSINNSIGFSINDLILKRISLEDYYKKYIDYFTVINRRSPIGHASVHKNNAKYFLEFVKENYII